MYLKLCRYFFPPLIIFFGSSSAFILNLEFKTTDLYINT